MMVRLVQGMLVLCLTTGILYCIRKIVSEHELPQKKLSLFLIFFFFSGFILQPAEWTESIVLILFISYIGAMAYTDYYTRQVYVMFYVIAAIIGYGHMAMHQKWESMWHIFLFVLIVLAGMLVHAYTLGDAEIFIAAAPYLSLIAERNEMEGLFLLLLFYWFSMILWPVNWLLYAMVKKKMETKFPMVPFIYGALIMILGMENLLN